MQQTLSPQMQQSLHILQAPITELRQLIASELAANPALEEVPREGNDSPADPGGGSADGADTGDMDWEWREYYAQRAMAEPWTAEALERRQRFLESRTRPPTLQEFLREQLDHEEMEARLRASAEVILGNIDADGYFRGTTAEAAYPVGCTELEAEDVLARIQQFDPPGVGARDLAECLVLQLRRTGRGDSLAAKIAADHLEEVARNKLHDIAKAERAGLDGVAEAVREIRRLDPRPGRAFAPDENPVIAPDVTIERDGEDFVVSLNEGDLPAVRISDDAKDLLGSSADKRDVRDYLREKIRGGRFFLKCIEQRNQTLLAIAKEIAARQRDFLEHGPAHLRPMTMSQVAAAVGVHETTVSRAVSGKYAATPHGLYELKFFFTSGYTTPEGNSVSNESVRMALAALVKSEDPARPLSDQAIVEQLTADGIPIARRTVAKYRDQLGIPPSHLRKQI